MLPRTPALEIPTLEIPAFGLRSRSPHRAELLFHLEGSRRERDPPRFSSRFASPHRLTRSNHDGFAQPYVRRRLPLARRTSTAEATGYYSEGLKECKARRPDG